MSIALKEANETGYWLNMLNDSKNIDEELFKGLIKDVNELISMLVSSLKTPKSKP